MMMMMAIRHSRCLGVPVGTTKSTSATTTIRRRFRFFSSSPTPETKKQPPRPRLHYGARIKKWVNENNMLPAVGHGAYLAIASGFLMTDMLYLRCLLVGGYTGLVAFHSMHQKPLRIPLSWSAVFVLVNAGAGCVLAYDQYCPLLSEDQEELYREHFQTTLSRGQFYSLMQMASFHEVPDNKILTLENQVCPNIYFVLKGRAKVYHRKAFAAYIDEGGFVNDVAFSQGGQNNTGAYGTVITVGDCSIIMWNQAELRQYMRSRPDMDRNMKYTLSKHLMKSLLKQREARHENDKLTDQEYRQEIEGAQDFFGRRRVTHRYGAPTYSPTT